MTKFRMLNLEEEFTPDKVVTNPDPMVKGEFTQDGVFSTTIFGDEEDVDNVDSMAWIDFGEGNYVIAPLMYTRIAKLIKPAYLDSIIQFNKRIDADGNFNDDLEDDKSIRTARIPHANIGLYEFKERFLEILNTYTPDEKKQSLEYRNLLIWYLQGKVFTSKIPIFSPKLRPAQIFKDEKILQFTEINTYYNFLISHSNNLKSIDGSRRLEDVILKKSVIMYKLQTNVNKILDNIIELIKGKRGAIRKMILAGRLNFSARNVITPNPKLRTDEVNLGYLTFLKLFELPLINLISLSENITFQEAKNFVDKAKLKSDPKMYKYMKKFLRKTKGDVRILINRNPSISVHSIALVKVKDILPNMEDVVMEMSNNILSGLGADFDGDVLNIIALFSRSQKDKFKPFSPVLQVVSGNDGKFNRVFSLTKDNKLAAYLTSYVNSESNEVEIVD